MPATIHVLDLRFQGVPHGIASFLVMGPTGPVLIETGPGSTLATLQSELKQHGLQPADVADVLLTHIHLDHAGAAGWWAQQGARVHVHHAGAPHLIEPGRLLSSAQRIYGEAMDRLWGEYLASPAHKVYAHHDGDVIQAGGLQFTAHDTPGHARHHFVYQLDDIAFTGDLAGVRLPEHPHLRLPTPPPEFELEAWQTSVERMRALAFGRLYLTHFGAVDAPEAHWVRVAALLPQYAERARAALDAGQDREALAATLQAWEETRLRAEGVAEALWPAYGSLAPGSMSADGLRRYWNKRGVGA
jgi:glyoxylase-like metal-dependent hydrolase (beta-lactamase superfamily II)